MAPQRRKEAPGVTDRPAPLFGVNINPYASQFERAFEIAKLADELGLDTIGIQDHPYNGSFADTWTLLSALAVSTRRIRFFTNVADLPLRPPAMLAKAAATLDIVTKGRVELGLGAGAFWPAIKSYGGPTRNPSEAVSALEEAISVVRLIWDYGGGGRTRASFRGKYYQLDNAQTGPRPYHKIGIWLGALGPRMLRLTGRLADGWSVSQEYAPPGRIPEMVRVIAKGASEANRSMNDIRKNYNISGVILDRGSKTAEPQEGLMIGSVDHWVETLVSYNRKLGFDSFDYWPATDDNEVEQIRVFAEKVVPSVRESLKFS